MYWINKVIIILAYIAGGGALLFALTLRESSLAPIGLGIIGTTLFYHILVNIAEEVHELRVKGIMVNSITKVNADNTKIDSTTNVDETDMNDIDMDELARRLKKRN